MTFDEAYKAYKRFLKEKGVYARALKIHSKGLFNERVIRERLFIIKPSQWIQDGSVFCSWRRTSEGDLFWWSVSILWQITCLEHDIILDGFRESKTSLNSDIINNVICYSSWAKENHFTGKNHDIIIEYKKENNL